MKNVMSFLSQLTSKPFVIQFVIFLTIEGSEETATQITSYLIPAINKDAARLKAIDMMTTLSDSYRNADGKIVNAQCLGIHSIDELEYVDEDNVLQLAVFQFASSTTATSLLDEPEERRDLPRIE